MSWKEKAVNVDQIVANRDMRVDQYARDGIAKFDLWKTISKEQYVRLEVVEAEFESQKKISDEKIGATLRAMEELHKKLDFQTKKLEQVIRENRAKADEAGKAVLEFWTVLNKAIREQANLPKPFERDKNYVTFEQHPRFKDFLIVQVECVCCGKVTNHDIFNDRKQEWENMKYPLCKKCARFLEDFRKHVSNNDVLLELRSAYLKVMEQFEVKKE
jgi:hypothetical protein